MTINNIVFCIYTVDYTPFLWNEFIQNRVFSIPIGQVFGTKAGRQRKEEGVTSQNIYTNRTHRGDCYKFINVDWLKHLALA